MTPDLRRLCEAAEGVLCDHGFEHLARAPEVSEAIVRAVLTELREVSDDGFRAMIAALGQPRQRVGHRGSDEVGGACIALDAYVDHILDTKARRAAALDELMKADGELL